MNSAATQHAGSTFVHSSAEVSPKAALGNGVRVWNNVQVREDVTIGDETSLGKNCYVDTGVQIGRRCKIQNNVSVYCGVTVEDGVFLGPHVCFTNDRIPRAINADGSAKQPGDWTISPTLVRMGASVGAGSVVLPGITLGRFCLVGAGSIVTLSVPDNGLVLGNPARRIGWVCDCGTRLDVPPTLRNDTSAICSSCGKVVQLHEAEA